MRDISKASWTVTIVLDRGSKLWEWGNRAPAETRGFLGFLTDRLFIVGF